MKKSAIKHAVCRWCYQDIPLEEFFQKVHEIGVKGIDLLYPKEWEITKKYNLACSLATDDFASIEHGFNDIRNHRLLKYNYKNLIKNAAHNGINNVIVFSGNRNGLNDEAGLENCARGLESLVKFAEEAGIILVMELLNSKIDHPNYQCDSTAWGVSLVDKIGSPNFKLLYDIYHMQIMEGDIISSIQKYSEYIAHYHTGGVPGRNEINNSQELNYQVYTCEKG
jgi:hydroxypyruvate isomerase